ncbi:hypothetical protein A0H81_09808 [Grifola frondosa]|uniref:Uncharacterized protein n=1 Tax=Grifola frondosa TaxID=5627 RepID=A0A1C7M1U2_GRIFR|nr:hypothetical protein A0H81_09808 [Grifola frondosa]
MPFIKYYFTSNYQVLRENTISVPAQASYHFNSAAYPPHVAIVFVSARSLSTPRYISVIDIPERPDAHQKAREEGYGPNHSAVSYTS